MYYVYVLLSIKDGKFYIGQTNNLRSRVERHHFGYVKSTKHRRPIKFIYYREFKTRSEAMRYEKYLKSGAGHNFLKEKLVDTDRHTGSG